MLKARTPTTNTAIRTATHNRSDKMSGFLKRYKKVPVSELDPSSKGSGPPKGKDSGIDLKSKHGHRTKGKEDGPSKDKNEGPSQSKDDDDASKRAPWDRFRGTKWEKYVGKDHHTRSAPQGLGRDERWNIWVVALPLPGVNYVKEPESPFDCAFWISLDDPEVKATDPDWAKGYGIELQRLPSKNKDGSTIHQHYAVVSTLRGEAHQTSALKMRLRDWHDKILTMVKVGEMTQPCTLMHIENLIDNRHTVAFPNVRETSADWMRRALTELKRNKQVLCNVPVKIGRSDGTVDAETFMTWLATYVVGLWKHHSEPETVYANWWDFWQMQLKPVNLESSN